MIKFIVPESQNLPELLYVIDVIMKYFLLINEYKVIIAGELLTLNIYGKNVRFTNCFSYDSESISEISFSFAKIEALLGHIIEDDTFQSDLPILTSPGNKSYVEVYHDEIYINFDFWGAIFLMLSRVEEIDAEEKQLDEHRRFKSDCSIAYKNNFLYRPIVDEYCEYLKQVISKLLPSFPFDETTYAPCISHDIDIPFKYYDKTFYSNFRKIFHKIIKENTLDGLNEFLAMCCVKSRVLKDPFNTFEWLLNLYNIHNIKANFYVPTTRCGQYDPAFDYKTPIFRDIIYNIKKNGHELGVHPGYSTMDSEENWNEEFKLFKKHVAPELIRGGRQHYLRFDIQTTLEFWENNYLDYDSSLGFADKIGYRCGTSRKYPLYNFKKKQQSKLLELPLVIMDVTLLRAKYMGIGLDSIFDLVSEYVVQAKKYKSNFVMTWHNFTLATQNNKELFKEIISIL